MDTEALTDRIPAEVVIDLVATAWQTFIGTELQPIDALGAVGESELMSSSISIGGPWNATIVLYVSRRIAFAGSAAVLGMHPDEIDEADVRDIIGELANIVGGNVKGVVSDAVNEWTLSLPVVSDGMLSVPGSKLDTEVVFVCEGEVVGCQVREHV